MDGPDALPAQLAADARAAFGDVVSAYQDLVYGVCLRVLRDPQLAEDVAQDAFVNAYRALGRYPTARIAELRLRPWLARIALNLARNALRDRKASHAIDGVPEPHAVDREARAGG